MDGSDHDVALRNSVIIPFLVISTVFIILRCYVGVFMTKVVGFDDVFAAVAWISLLAQSFVELHEIQIRIKQGVGAGLSDIPTSNLLYIITTGFLRLAVTAFLPRLNKQQMFKSLVWTIGFVTAVQTSTCFFVYLLACKDVRDLWNSADQQRQCLDAQHEAYIFWAQSASGVAIDLNLLMMATWAVFFYKRDSAWNFKAIVCLSIGLSVLTAGVLQLGALISTDFTKHSTSEIDTSSIWMHLQEHIGLWLACLPTIQPMSNLITKRLGRQSKQNSIDYGQPGADIAVGRSNKRLAPIRRVPGPQIGIAISTDLETGPLAKGAESTKLEERELSRLKSVHVHSRSISNGSIIKTTEVEVTSSRGSWHPSKTWIST